MVQIGLLIMAVGLVGAGVWALMGKEKAGSQTSKPVAIAMTVLGVVLAVIALVVIPSYGF